MTGGLLSHTHYYFIPTNNEGLIGKWKVKESNQEMIKFKILRGERRLKARLDPWTYRKVDFGIFRDLHGRVQ